MQLLATKIFLTVTVHSDKKSMMLQWRWIFDAFGVIFISYCNGYQNLYHTTTLARNLRS